LSGRKRHETARNGATEARCPTMARPTAGMPRPTPLPSRSAAAERRARSVSHLLAVIESSGPEARITAACATRSTPRDRACSRCKYLLPSTQFERAVIAERTKAGLWLPTVRRMRPAQPWGDVVRVLNRTAESTWTEERLRRTVRRLVSEASSR
jgi:hypothetical protein